MRIRRRGRHTAPSQVEKVAEKAGKAAPAMAIAGALVAAPQAQHAFTAAAKPGTVAATDWRGAAGTGGAGQQQHATTLELGLGARRPRQQHLDGAARRDVWPREQHALQGQVR